MTTTQLFRIQFPLAHSKAQPAVHSGLWKLGLFSAASEPGIFLQSVLMKVTGQAWMDKMNVTRPANPKAGTLYRILDDLAN